MTVTRLNDLLMQRVFTKPSGLLGYGLAVLTVAAATAATIYIPVIGERAAFLLLFFGIIQVCFWFGQNPGILATALSLVAVNVLILFPSGIGRHDILILNIGFCLVSAVMIATTSFHRRSAKALFDITQDLDHAQAIGQIGSWRMNVQRNELSWSDENHRIFGVPKGTPMTYETFLAAVHPDDREYVDKMWQAGLRGEPYDVVHRLIVAGQVKWVRERALLEFGEKGNLLGGFGTTQDITERKRSEQALMESQQRYAGIVDSAMDAFIVIGADQHILLFNIAAESMFGLRAEEAIGSSIERFIPEWCFPSIGRHGGAIGRSGGAHRTSDEGLIIRGLRANGEDFPLEVSISKCEVDGEPSYTAILRDITERERAKFALNEQIRLQDQLTKVAATVPGLICSFRLRPDGTASMPYASPVFESIYGFRFDAVSEDFSPVFARIHPDDVGHVNDSIAESARTQQPWRDTFRYHHPIKGEIWIEGHSMPQREMDGSILWHGYIQDVSERIHAERELQDRIERYELVLEGAQDAIWDWDVLNKRVHFSSHWKALRGLTEDEVGNDEAEWSANIHPHDVARVLAAVKAHFEGKSPVFCEEYRIRCKDGSWKWILDRGIAQKDKSGKVIRMAGSESDITERKLAETALRDQESQLRLIMNATPALISYVDTDYRYLRVNKTYENWFGLSAEHILGHEVREIIGETAWKMLRPYFERSLAGERVSFDRAIPYAEGPPRWVHVTYIPHKDLTGTVKGIVIHVVDIEERKQAEQSIVSLNQRLQRQAREMQVIFNTVPIGIAIADDSTGHSIRGNRAMERMLGLPPHAELSMQSKFPPAIRVIQDRQERAIDELPLQRAMLGEAVSNQILDIVRSDGQTLTVLCSASPIFDDDGGPRGAVGAFLDITALKRTEESLKRSQAQLRLFIQQAPVCIAMLDREMNYLVTSRRWVDEFGRGYADVAGRNHYEVNPDIAAEWKQLLGQAQAGGFLKNDDELWVQADGSRHWLRWMACPWSNQEGDIGGIIISCEDITARRKAEEELRKTEARLALIVEEVKAGYWDWDPMSRNLFLSPELKRQIGFDGKDLLNRWEEWVPRLHPDDRAMVLAATENYIAGRQPVYEMEFRLRHKDGSYRWIHSRGLVLRDQNNEPCRMLGINLDITDYKKQRELNERRDEMEKSFRLHVAIQTAAAIAHELNQPLAAISSYADVAQHMLTTDKLNPQKLSQVLESCSHQAQRAGQVILQLLTLLHKGEIVSEPLDINVSVCDALDLVGADSDFKAFKIERNLAADLPPVLANALQIQKVLVNLLRNGLESMQDKQEAFGSLIVTSRRSEDEPSMAQVTVCDSGTGVADTATLRTMFQAFYTTKATGLGMGLAISRALIEAHGGKMWAEQNPDQGISIHFTLPFVT